MQIPFYFKSIVDGMNIDFMAVGGTAATVAGSLIVACPLRYLIDSRPRADHIWQMALLVYAQHYSKSFAMLSLRQ